MWWPRTVARVRLSLSHLLLLIATLVVSLVPSVCQATASSAPSSSDYVAVFQALASSSSSASLATLPPLSFQQEVPLELQRTLRNVSLVFTDLSPLLQRALLWDHGYSLGDDQSLAQIFTLCGTGMAELAITEREFAATNCATQPTCRAHATFSSSSRSTEVYASAQACRANQLMAATKCSCTAVSTVSKAPSLWVSGPQLSAWPLEVNTTSKTNPDQEFKRDQDDMVALVPELRIRRNQWVDVERGEPVHVYSIQARTGTGEAASKHSHSHSHSHSSGGTMECVENSDALVIPCVPFQRTDSRWCRPSPSPRMLHWLWQFARDFHAQKKQAIDEAVQVARNQSLAEQHKDRHSVVVNHAFVMNGSSSDLAQQFYRQYVARIEDHVDTTTSVATSMTDSALATTPMVIDGGLPAEMAQRLLQVSLHFDELPPLLQRALVWDTGYAYGDGNQLAAIYVPCGLSMADIAISRRSFERVGCRAQDCPNGDDDTKNKTVFARSQACTGDQIAAASRCATTDVSAPVHVAIWATGGHADLVPDVNIQRHTWEDPYRSYLVYGLHVVRAQVPAGKCPPPSGDGKRGGAMIIPCLPYSAVAATNQWCRPEYGALVTSWLRREARDKGFNWLVLVPVLLAVALAATGITVCIRRKVWTRVDLKRARVPPPSPTSHTTLQSMMSGYPDGVLLTHSSCGYADHVHVQGERDARITRDDDARHGGGDAGDAGAAGDGYIRDRDEHGTEYAQRDSRGELVTSFSTRSSLESEPSLTSNSVLHTLTSTPSLASARIPFAELQFQRMLAQGGHGEVWLATHAGVQVAAKRLLRTRKNRFDDLDAFAREIALLASLRHPHVLQFLGVAWNTLSNLCLVTEFVSNGDLQQLLRRGQPQQPQQQQHGEHAVRTLVLSWHQEKPRIARDIARALQYLHGRSPATIHRDLKSKNVLLTASVRAKLIDFGVSRDAVIGGTMTNGVGTPYWTAPEVLQGQVYSEKADMYSFGIVLCELDTGVTPYQDLRTQAGAPEYTPLQILQHVVAGALRPTLSTTCPPRIAALAQDCLHRDPRARPSATQVLAVLDRICEEEEDHDDDGYALVSTEATQRAGRQGADHAARKPGSRRRSIAFSL